MGKEKKITHLPELLNVKDEGHSHWNLHSINGLFIVEVHLLAKYQTFSSRAKANWVSQLFLKGQIKETQPFQPSWLQI